MVKSTSTERIKNIINEVFPALIKIRRHLHQFPELSFQEHNTSLFIQNILKEWQIDFTNNWAKTGIVGFINGKNQGQKTIALRADMDALPIQEMNALSYCSEQPGVMHACGHDVHMTCLLGALYALKETKQEWEGTVKFIFQPGEEKLPGGASLLIDQGILENPVPDLIIGQHVQPNMDVGVVGLCSGKAMASCDELYIQIIGKGGHAAMPSLANNPIGIASALVLELNQLLKICKDSGIDAILSIGKFNTIGGATNIIPEIVNLEGTFRCMDEEFRSKIHLDLVELGNKLALATHSTIEIRIDKGYPCLMNDLEESNRFFKVAGDYLGNDHVLHLPPRMTSEDFAYYSQRIPAVFYRLGTGVSENVHTPQFIVNEESIRVGAGIMASLTLDFLKNT